MASQQVVSIPEYCRCSLCCAWVARGLGRITGIWELRYGIWLSATPYRMLAFEIVVMNFSQEVSIFEVSHHLLSFARLHHTLAEVACT